MKKIKKFLMITIIIIIIGLIIYIVFQKWQKEKIVNEYEPETEISDNDERKTMVSLYFENKKTENIEPEGRLIDVKDLVEKPYGTLLELLIDGPKNENLKSVIPSDTKINNIYINGEMIVVDFSKEFIDNHPGGEKNEKNTINSIVKTLTELTEVNSVKLIIDGKENKSFKDNIINFSKEFYREK